MTMLERIIAKMTEIAAAKAYAEAREAYAAAAVGTFDGICEACDAAGPLVSYGESKLCPPCVMAVAFSSGLVQGMTFAAQTFSELLEEDEEGGGDGP